MKIKYIRAKNFLSIGEDGIEIDFTKYGNIVNIKGENRDNGPGASNAAGKSSISEVVVYSLFGELIKDLNHGEAIHLDAKGRRGQGLEVELHFDLGGHEYCIIRKRKGSEGELELWKDGVNESKGGIPATQDEINKIVKLNSSSFANIVCFGQHNAEQFLGCKAADKRAIAENLLSLDKYNKYCKSAKDRLKTIQDQIKTFSLLYDKNQQEVAATERQIKQIAKQQGEWKSAQLNAIDRLRQQASRLKAEMAKVSAKSASKVSYEEIQSITAQVEEKVKKKGELTLALQQVQEKIIKIQETRQNAFLATKEYAYAIKQAEKQRDDAKKANHDLMCSVGSKCPVCYGKVDKSNLQSVIDYNQTQVEELNSQLKDLAESLKAHQAKYQADDERLVKLKLAYQQAQEKDAELNRSIRELEQKKVLANASFRESADSATLLIEQQIANVNDQIEAKTAELSNGDPYIAIMDDAELTLLAAQNKSEEYRGEITNLEKRVPYFDFWIKAFGDNGIRSFILDEIIPILNARINYWLQFLIDNRIKLTFDSSLDEKIEKLDKKFLYRGMSGGEVQRVNLGIALAFAQVMMLSAGTSPSIIFLDEVGTNLDRPGIQAIYNTICELSRERQVLVTTHDPDLQELLSGYDTITIVKENGVSRLQN